MLQLVPLYSFINYYKARIVRAREELKNWKNSLEKFLSSSFKYYKEKKKTNLSSQPKKLQFLDFLFCVSAEIGNSCGRLPPQAKVITMPDDGECYLW